MKEITMTIPYVDFFYHISPAPPPEISRFDLAHEQAEFLATDPKTNLRAVIKRIDFHTFKLDGPLPFSTHILAFALNTGDEKKARQIISKRFPGKKEVAFFLFKIIEILPQEK